MPGNGNGELFQKQLLRAVAGTGCDRTDLANEPGVSSSIVYLEGAGMEHCPWQRFGYHEMRVKESSLGWLWVFPADSVWTTQVKFVLVSRLNIEQR